MRLGREPDGVVDIEPCKVVDAQQTADGHKGIHFEFIETSEKIHGVISVNNRRQKEAVMDHFEKVAYVIGDVKVVALGIQIQLAVPLQVLVPIPYE